LCENCFLEFFDGRDQTAPARGRFCGHSYPPVFVSSSNHLMVVLRCHGKPPIARFKAFYQSVTGRYLVCSESITTSRALVGIYLPPVLSVTTKSMCTLSTQTTALEPKPKQKFHIQTYNINLQTVTEMGGWKCCYLLPGNESAGGTRDLRWSLVPASTHHVITSFGARLTLTSSWPHAIKARQTCPTELMQI